MEFGGSFALQLSFIRLLIIYPEKLIFDPVIPISDIPVWIFLRTFFGSKDIPQLGNH